MFFRPRIINGRTYYYSEERWREGGKVRSRSRIVKGAVSKDDAKEKYRDILRNNAYLYGRQHPGERYAREARAREEYQKGLTMDNRVPDTLAEIAPAAPSYPAHSQPTDADECAHAQWSANQAAQRDEDEASYSEQGQPDAPDPSAAEGKGG